MGRQLGVNGTPTIMVRYGEGDPTILNLNGQSYENSVPYDVLAQMVSTANAS